MRSRSRQEIQMSVAFLTTHVKKPDDYDWVKLKRVLKYIKVLRELKLTFRCGDMSVVKLWVDTPYAGHEYCQVHTGAMVILGKGAVSSFSTKKYKQKSSIEGLLIGVDDAMAKILWSKYFIEAQGYNIEHNRLMQDNNIAIILGVNGKLFRSKRTKHIKTRYFFVM